jgi:hypothetical protein
MPFNGSSNVVDAAVLAVIDATQIETLSTFKQLNLNYFQNLEFATTTEIDNIVINKNPIFKAGMRTGPVGWPGSAPWGSELCSLTATQMNVSTNVAFEDYTGSYTIPFDSCIVYRGTNTVASDSGDSGSVVCALINHTNPSLSAWKIIGLTFAGAGSTNNSISVACRIDTVCNVLQLTSWDGQTTNLNNLNNEAIIYTNGISTSAYVDAGNKRYWQTGLVM